MELPFSNRHQRLEKRPDLPPKICFPLTVYLSLVCICPEQISSPKAKVISLPLPISILAHLPFNVALQHLESALGYPIGGCRVEIECVGYPITPPSNCQPLAIQKCASLRGFTRRRISRRMGIRIQCRQFVKVTDSQG